MKPAEPIPLPIAWKPSKLTGTSRSAAVTTAFATPEKTALTVRPGVTPLPTASMTARNGVPISTSPTSGAMTSPTTVVTMVPGDSGVPIERNQAAPLARMCGMFERVSTLLTIVGLEPEPAISPG